MKFRLAGLRNFTVALHVPLGHPETMKSLVGWVQRSATHQVFSEAVTPVQLGLLRVFA